MSKALTTPVYARRIFLLIVLATLLFAFASVSTAYAQEYEEDIMFSSNETNPAAYSSPDSNSDPAGYTDSNGGSSGGGDGSGAGTSDTGVLGVSLLPETGGPLYPLVGLAALALGATGVLALSRSREHGTR